jgi:hypothetical protein
VTGREVAGETSTTQWSSAQHHPTLPRLALPFGNIIRIADIGPLSEDERLLRLGLSRFDAAWHRGEAINADPKSPGSRFKRAYHWSQLALHEPLVPEYWTQLEGASEVADNAALPLKIANLVLQASPDLARVFSTRPPKGEVISVRGRIARSIAGLGLRNARGETQIARRKTKCRNDHHRQGAISCGRLAA